MLRSPACIRAPAISLIERILVKSNTEKQAIARRRVISGPLVAAALFVAFAVITVVVFFSQGYDSTGGSMPGMPGMEMAPAAATQMPDRDMPGMDMSDDRDGDGQESAPDESATPER